MLCQDRAVPAWVLSGLVKAQGIPWQVGPQGAAKRLSALGMHISTISPPVLKGEELRATLLLQLSDAKPCEGSRS